MYGTEYIFINNSLLEDINQEAQLKSPVLHLQPAALCTAPLLNGTLLACRGSWLSMSAPDEISLQTRLLHNDYNHSR